MLAIVLLATLFSAYSFLTAPKQYGADATFTVRQQNTAPADPNTIFTFNGYYNWIASEYLVDDYTQVIESDSFGKSVLATIMTEVPKGGIIVSDTEQLMADVENMKPRDVVDAVGADRRHRELRFFAVTSSKDLTIAIMQASAIVLTQPLTAEGLVEPYRGKTTDRPLFAQIDQITYDDIKTGTSKEITNAITRIIMGLVAAVAIAFLLEYLDNSVRDEKDARKVLDLPVLGAIPRI